LRSGIDRARTILVTGANRGIGLGVARGLARHGHRVLMACRDPRRAAAAREELARDPEVGAAGGRVELEGPLDLASLDSVRAFVRGCRAEEIDVLVNNAGVFCPEREETSDGFERCLGVNFLGPFLLTRLLLPRLSCGGRIVNVSSIAGLFGRFDPQDLGLERGYGPFRAYARSKYAIILASLELAERLRGRIRVNALHPGIVNTDILTMRRWYDPLADLLFRPFVLGIDAGAAPILDLALLASHEATTGQYFSRRRQLRLGPRLSGEEARRAIWDLGSALAGLDPEWPEGYTLPGARRET
jgi:NAD(P)-dependent dehydrogenase (short-subunit alcohol dehydrogenase family)